MKKIEKDQICKLRKTQYRFLRDSDDGPIYDENHILGDVGQRVIVESFDCNHDDVIQVKNIDGGCSYWTDYGNLDNGDPENYIYLSGFYNANDLRELISSMEKYDLDQ